LSTGIALTIAPQLSTSPDNIEVKGRCETLQQKWEEEMHNQWHVDLSDLAAAPPMDRLKVSESFK
jgi:hypothetical protein